MRYLPGIVVWLFLLLIVILTAVFAQDPGDLPLTPPPPPTCDVTVTPNMIPGVMYVSCGPVPSPCTCIVTFPQGQTSAGLTIIPDSNVTLNVIGGGQ